MSVSYRHWLKLTEACSAQWSHSGVKSAYEFALDNESLMIQLPLFPLNVVLFPGGVLPLRIFEPRYTSMVSESLKQGSGFAIMTIEEQTDTSQATAFYSLGTLAEIVDFDQLDGGMLGITCRGGERVLIEHQRQRADRLIIGTGELQAPEPAITVDASHQPLSQFLGSLLKREEIQPYRRWLQEDWHSACWLGFRLAELLPLPLAFKHYLLEIDDARERLDILDTVLRDNELL